MNKSLPLPLPLGALAIAASLLFASPAFSQVAGVTTQSKEVETTLTAMGWSVKKTLMGKNIYNEAGDKVGKVEDLIIDTQRNVSYIIVGAGGFIGIGRHDVAIPVGQIQDRSGRLVMPGATQDAIKALATFDYADTSGTATRDRFIASAERDIASARFAVNGLTKKASTATADARVVLDGSIATLQGEVKTTEATLARMKSSSAARWKEYEADVAAATARLRKSVETATS